MNKLKQILFWGLFALLLPCHDAHGMLKKMYKLTHQIKPLVASLKVKFKSHITPRFFINNHKYNKPFFKYQKKRDIRSNRYKYWFLLLGAINSTAQASTYNEQLESIRQKNGKKYYHSLFGSLGQTLQTT